MEAPVLVEAIPAQVVNEQASYGPVDLNDFISTPSDEAPLRFVAQLSTGAALPKGLICTSDGVLTGIPAKGTEGHYQIEVLATNEAGSVTATFSFSIKPAFVVVDQVYLDKLKAQVWDALGQNLPVPDISELYNQPFTPLEMYYLLERWGIIKIWDAFNLDAPGDKTLLTLEGASPHYVVYDRGSCLVAGPKDLFSHERTLQDGLDTAKAMAREIYKRNWTIELSGFDKFTRAAWIELQHLGDKNGKYLEIINFSPSTDDMKMYTNQVVEMAPKPGSGD